MTSRVSQCVPRRSNLLLRRLSGPPCVITTDPRTLHTGPIHYARRVSTGVSVQRESSLLTGRPCRSRLYRRMSARCGTPTGSSSAVPKPLFGCRSTAIGNGNDRDGVCRIEWFRRRVGGGGMSTSISAVDRVIVIPRSVLITAFFVR